MFKTASVIDRKTSVDVDGGLVYEIIGETPDVDWDTLPVAVLPKELIYDFDLRGPSEALSLLDSGVDSKAAVSVLLAVAMEADLPGCTEEVYEHLYEICHRIDVPPLAADDRRASLELGQTLVGPSADWWVSACEVPKWAAYVALFSKCFILMPQVGVPPNRFLIKWRRSEALHDQWRGRPAEALSARPAPARSLSVPLHDLGRARAEHLRMLSPEGTFLTDGAIIRRASGALEYSARPSRLCQAFYVHWADPGPASLLINMWPSRRGFVTPVRVVAWYTSLVLSLIAIAQVTLNFLVVLQEEGGPTLAALLFLPSAMVAFLFVRDEHELRWELLRPWRRLTFWTGVPLVVAVSTLFVPPVQFTEPTTVWPIVMSSIWISCALAAALIALRLHGLGRAVDHARAEAEILEQRPMRRIDQTAE